MALSVTGMTEEYSSYMLGCPYFILLTSEVEAAARPKLTDL